MTLGQKHLLPIRTATPGRWYLRQKLLPAAEDAESIAQSLFTAESSNARALSGRLRAKEA
jgi:hypothetical protein